MLEDLLARIRALIGTAFETWILLKPGSPTYANGLFDLTTQASWGRGRRSACNSSQSENLSILVGRIH